MKQLFLLLLISAPIINFSQYCDSFDLSLESELEMGCTSNTITALHDQLDRAYLYTANAEGGLSVLSLEDPTDMSLITNLGADNFEGLTVNRIIQNGHLLYLTLGSMFGAHDQPSGLAIVNVENPLFPEVLDVWASAENAGAAHVALVGNYAFLCGLSNGLIILNVIDPAAISFVTQYIPPTDWPVETDPEKIKARNIVIEGNTAYLAYDAGGVRILDITDIMDIEEIGRYSNPALDGAARAYNNIIKRDELLFVAVDYAGMEVLDVSTPADITLHGWWNPNGFPLASPAVTSWRWFSSPWHTNEMEIIDECGIIFMACGRTEIIGVDVSNPADPVLCGFYGDSTDAISSYGLSRYKDRIYVGHICVPPVPFVPFPGIWSGIKSFVYDSDCPLSVDELDKTSHFNIYPNPANTQITLNLTQNKGKPIDQISIIDLSGKRVLLDKNGNLTLNVAHLERGVYIVQVQIGDAILKEKLVLH